LTKSSFDKAFELTLGHEGGYVNNPSDPGGATKYGITEKVARASGYTGSMASLPLELAKDIYKTQYWNTIKGDNLPNRVAEELFDTAVNHGVKQAVIFAQKAVGTTADGILGSKTLSAIQAMPVDVFLRKFNGARLTFYTNLSTWSVFGKGWARRVAVNLQR